MTTKRNEQRSRAGKKLLVEREKDGRFRDVIDYAKSSRQDQRRTTVGEAEKKVIAMARLFDAAVLGGGLVIKKDPNSRVIQLSLAIEALTAARKRARAGKRKGAK